MIRLYLPFVKVTFESQSTEDIDDKDKITDCCFESYFEEISMKTHISACVSVFVSYSYSANRSQESAIRKKYRLHIPKNILYRESILITVKLVELIRGYILLISDDIVAEIMTAISDTLALSNHVTGRRFAYTT